MNDLNLDSEEGGEELTPQKSKPPLLLLLLVFLNLGATGFVAFKVVSMPAEKVIEKVIVEKVKEDEGAGPIETLEPFVVNLNDPRKPRFLKVGLDVEVTDARALSELKEAQREVRNALMLYLSGLSLEQTLGEDAKVKMQQDIVARLDGAIGEGRVRRVYFTEFVVQ